MSGSGFTLQLVGIPRLTSPGGADVTPRMVKTQGLLAFLALAEEQPVDRPTLQNLLWGDRMPQQGRDSLKKALSEIRRCFEDAPVQPLETDGGPVRLNLEHIDVDVLQPQPPDAGSFYRPQFLNGVSLPDEPFNRWVLGVRAKMSAKHGRDGANAISRHGPATAPSSGIVQIRLMPLMVREYDQEGRHLASRVADSLTGMLRHAGVFRVFDTRNGTEITEGGAPTPDLNLTITATSIGEDAVLGMRLTRILDAEQIWAMEDIFDLKNLDIDRVNVCTAAAFEQICASVLKRSDIFGEKHVAARTLFGAVDRIFRLSKADLDAAETSLAEISDALDSSPLYAWYAFLSAFQIEKIGRASGSEIIERAEFLSAKAIEADRTNPLSRALCSHVQSFVLRDMDRAFELVAPIRHLASQNVMLADTVAMLHYYKGDYAGAKRYASVACDLGQWHPFSYSFTTSLAMSQLMLGEYGDAIGTAKRAIAQHPLRDGHRYEPTLRTLATAQSLHGQIEEGRKTIELLDRQNGTRTIDRMTDADDAPFPNTEAFSLVRGGLLNLYG